MEEKSFDSIVEAHRYSAVSLHGETWDVLEKSDRSNLQTNLMLHAAHASLYHWLQAGSEVNHQRGEWLIARIQAVIGHPDQALAHARRTLELTEAIPA